MVVGSGARGCLCDIGRTKCSQIFSCALEQLGLVSSAVVAVCFSAALSCLPGGRGCWCVIGRMKCSHFFVLLRSWTCKFGSWFCVFLGSFELLARCKRLFVRYRKDEMLASLLFV